MSRLRTQTVRVALQEYPHLLAKMVPIGHVDIPLFNIACGPAEQRHTVSRFAPDWAPGAGAGAGTGGGAEDHHPAMAGVVVGDFQLSIVMEEIRTVTMKVRRRCRLCSPVSTCPILHDVDVCDACMLVVCQMNVAVAFNGGTRPAPVDNPRLRVSYVDPADSRRTVRTVQHVPNVFEFCPELVCVRRAALMRAGRMCAGSSDSVVCMHEKFTLRC